MGALKQMIVDCLAKHPEISSFEISARMAQPLDEVQRELWHLRCDGQVVTGNKVVNDGDRDHVGSPTYLLAESRESTGAGDTPDALSEMTGLSALTRIEDIGMPADENLGDEAAGAPNLMPRRTFHREIDP